MIKHTKIDIIELMNQNEECKEELNKFNDYCKAHNISPNSEVYKDAREKLVMLLMYKVDEIREAFAKNMYYELRGEIKNN